MAPTTPTRTNFIWKDADINTLIVYCVGNMEIAQKPAELFKKLGELGIHVPVEYTPVNFQAKWRTVRGECERLAAALEPVSNSFAAGSDQHEFAVINQLALQQALALRFPVDAQMAAKFGALLTCGQDARSVKRHLKKKDEEKKAANDALLDGPVGVQRGSTTQLMQKQLREELEEAGASATHTKKAVKIDLQRHLTDEEKALELRKVEMSQAKKQRKSSSTVGLSSRVFARANGSQPDFSERSSRLDEREKQLNGREKELNEREKELNECFKEREKELHERSMAREVCVGEREKRLDERDERFGKREKLVGEREQLVGDREQRVQAHEVRLGETLTK